MFDELDSDDDTSDNSVFECVNANYNISISLNNTETMLLHSPCSVSSSPVQIEELKSLTYPEYLSICQEI